MIGKPCTVAGVIYHTADHDVSSVAPNNGVVSVHLRSLPPSITQDVISGYLEAQGDDVEVKFVIMKGDDNEAIAIISGLTHEGKSARYDLCVYCSLYIISQFIFTHRTFSYRAKATQIS